MRIVIDTNVLISGVFFGGFPREILRAVVCQKITACATTEIINEYEEIVQEMIDRKQGHINRTILSPLIKTMEIIEPVTHVEICRDPDDNKFLECAKDSHAFIIAMKRDENNSPTEGLVAEDAIKNELQKILDAIQLIEV